MKVIPNIAAFCVVPSERDIDLISYLHTMKPLASANGLSDIISANIAF